MIAELEKFISLYDMLRYDAEAFCALTDQIGRIVGIPAHLVQAVIQNQAGEFRARLAKGRELCDRYGWTETSAQISEIEQYITGHVLPHVLQARLETLNNHLRIGRTARLLF